MNYDYKLCLAAKTNYRPIQCHNLHANESATNEVVSSGGCVKMKHMMLLSEMPSSNIIFNQLPVRLYNAISHLSYQNLTFLHE